MIRWALPIIGGLLFSLGFPNELLPGALGDHPPSWLAWLALWPVMWMLYRWPARTARRGIWLYGLTSFFGILSWMHLFGVLPWLLLALILSVPIWLTVCMTQNMALPRWLMPLSFACAWTGLEWARSQSIFAFGWGEIGASQVDGSCARLASLGGVYLLSFLMLLLTGTVLQYLLDHDTPRGFLVSVAGVTLLCLGAGYWQTAHTESRWRHAAQSQVFALIQPCAQRGLTPQALITPLSYAEISARERTLLALSQQSLQHLNRPATQSPAVVVWSETALPYPPSVFPDVTAFSRRHQCYLLAGAPYYPPGDNDHPSNSAFLFTPNGQQADRYSKIHLVPFGEFVPMRKLVQRFYTVRDSDIIPGPGWRVLHVGALRVGVGICFESTFPDIARAYANQGAQYLIYITNDAWFHQTSGVRQHYNHARFRALETGLPVVRVAGTGISGFIAPDGRSFGEIPVYLEQTNTLSLPAGTPGTIYTLFGWAFAPLCLLASILCCIRGIWISRRMSQVPHDA